MEKWYKAVVCGKPVDNHGVYVDYLRQNQGENRSEIVDKSAAGSKRAELSYTAEASTERCDAGESREYSLVRIRLLTGRHHQIRVQFSGHGTPLYGMINTEKRQLPDNLTYWLCAPSVCPSLIL